MKIKNIIISFVLNLLIINAVSAMLTDEDKAAVKYAISTQSKLHEYIELWEDSNAHGKHKIFRSLSVAAKLLAAATSGVSGSLDFLPIPDDAKRKASGGLAVSSMIFVILDGIWFQKYSNHYAEAPKKLQEWLEKEADSIANDRKKLAHKNAFLFILQNQLEYQRKHSGEQNERSPLNIQDDRLSEQYPQDRGEDEKKEEEKDAIQQSIIQNARDLGIPL